MDIKKKKFILLPVAIGVVLIAVSMLLGDPSVVGNMIVIAGFISVVPYFAYKYSRYAWLNSVEREFPNFIRDLADSKRSGISLDEAVHIASRSNYGKLSPEVKTMSNKLSWGVPFLRTVEMIEEKLKDSVSIVEALNIIRESYKSGGDVVATLDSAARNMNMVKEAEAERKSITSQHVMITYGIFFMFLAIIIIIIYILVPMMSSSTETGGELGMSVSTFSNPCMGYFMPFPCELFGLTCMVFEVDPESVGCYYVSLFFYVLLIQGIFSGLIAGQLGDNSAVAGMKHSLIMISAAIFVFFFLAKFGLIPT